MPAFLDCMNTYRMGNTNPKINLAFMLGALYD